MAEGGKFVNRPKVRFCQREDDDEDQEHDKNQRISAPARKPSIRSIIPVEKPYKIVSIDENLTSKTLPANEKNWENVFGHQKRNLPDFDAEELFASSLRKFPSSSSMAQRSSVEFAFPKEYEFNNQSPSDSSFSSKDEIVQNPKIVEVEVHASDFPNIPIQNGPKPLSKEAQTAFNPRENLFKDQETIFDAPENSFREKFETEEIIVKSPKKKNLSAIPEESLEFEILREENSSEPEPLKVSEELKLITRKTLEPKSPRKTFKCTSPLKRQLNSINRLSKSRKSPKKSVFQENPKNLRLSATNSKIRARPLGFMPRSSKPKVSGVMPCLKAKMAAKVKTSPVKKTVLRNVVVKPAKVFVGPGVPRPRRELKVDFEEEPRVNFQTLNPEKLSKPEYNSIMCTINKLKEIQKENIVTDVEHLPPIYKSLINGKVTNSLDFPPDEAIFKNLINLSIDETQLPMRITRSKDPEPRQRDAVPKLSDFFVPKYANEYCTAVCAKPRSPEPVENWSAFRISDKIRGWKWNMDFVH